MSRQVRVSGEPADSSGLSPLVQEKVVVQLQPLHEQTWGAGMWQLQMGLVPARVLHGDLGSCTVQVPAMCWPPASSCASVDSTA